MSDRLPSELALALDRVRPRLGAFARRLIYFASVTSTNDIAARLASADAEEGVTVTADVQTAGRGRRGRDWYSPAGAGIYTSIVLGPFPDQGGKPQLASMLGLLTLTAGVGIADGIRCSTGLGVELKWPNDLVVGRRKLGGILAEGIGTPAGVQRVVLGFGVNVQAAAYPRELESRVTSLEGELGRRVDREQVMAECLAQLATRYADLRNARFHEILERWRTLAPSSVGRQVEWHRPDGLVAGITAGIDARGALLVRAGDETVSIVAGELTWL